MPGPPQVVDERFEAACLDATLAAFRGFTLPMAMMFAVFGVANAVRLPPAAGFYLAMHDAVLVALFLGLRAAAARVLVPHPANGVVAMAIPLAILSNTMLSAWVGAAPMPTLFVSLLLVGIGGTYLVVRWAVAAMLACTLASLPFVVHLARDGEEALEQVVVLVTAIGLGALFLYGGRRAARRITLLRLQDADRQHDLEQALAVAEQARGELDRRVAERTRELAAARDAIAAELADRKVAEDGRRQLERRLADAQRMESVGRLAGGIAHDFNNLLMVIGGNVELLLENQQVAEREKADLREIQDAVTRSSRLIRQLLASGRRQVMQIRRTTLPALIDDVRPMIERVLGADIALTVDDRPPAPAVNVDPDQLEQVILNLVLNARDAMPRGGTVTIRTRTAHVDDPAGAGHPDVSPGPYAVLEVVDSGTGMDEAVRRSAFEPFFTTKGVHSGSGLGLAAVSGIVSQHAGFVDVISAPGHGSTFAVFVPSAGDAAAPAASAAEGARLAAPGHERVLVVEDEPVLLRLAINGLAHLGYQVLSASDGDAALRLLDTGPPIDLLVTDVIMPGLDGVELADRVRARWPGTRVLFMSGFAGERLTARGLDSDDELLLQKPFSLRELADRVRALLDKPPSGRFAAIRGP